MPFHVKTSLLKFQIPSPILLVAQSTLSCPIIEKLLFLVEILRIPVDLFVMEISGQMILETGKYVR